MGNDDLEEDEPSNSQVVASSNKYFLNATEKKDNDVDAGFSTILSKSQKKRFRKKATMEAKTEWYNT